MILPNETESAAYFTPYEGKLIEPSFIAVDLKSLLQSILGTTALVDVVFGWYYRDGMNTAVFRVTVNKKQGRAEEFWSVDFGVKCIRNPREAGRAVARIRQGFEEMEKSENLKNNDNLNIKEI